MLQLIEWFKTMAEPKYRVFLVGGVPSRWRDLTGDSITAPIWRDVYESLDGIHPWHVGRWSSISYSDWWYNNRIARDAARCAELGILYMPTMCKFYLFLLGGPQPFKSKLIVCLLPYKGLDFLCITSEMEANHTMRSQDLEENSCGSKHTIMPRTTILHQFGWHSSMR